MGKLNVVMLRYLSREHFRVLTAVSREGGRLGAQERGGGLRSAAVRMAFRVVG